MADEFTHPEKSDNLQQLSQYGLLRTLCYCISDDMQNEGTRDQSATTIVSSPFRLTRQAPIPVGIVDAKSLQPSLVSVKSSSKVEFNVRT